MTNPRLFFIGSLAVVVVALLLAILNARPIPAPPAPQAPGPGNPDISITWSQAQLSQTLFPGTNATSTVTFRSTRNFRDVQAQIAPPLAGVVSVQPTNFPEILAGQDYRVTVTLSASPIFEKKEFIGTVHLRKPSPEHGPAGILETRLPVTLRTDFNTFTNPSMNYELKFPLEFAMSETTIGQNLGLITPLTKSAREDPDAVETFDDIGLVVERNPLRLPVLEFAKRYEGGWFESYRSRSEISVGGQPAVRYSDLAASPGHAPMLAVFVNGGNDRIFIFTVSHYESRESLPLIPVFDQIVASFALR